MGRCVSHKKDVRLIRVNNAGILETWITSIPVITRMRTLMFKVKTDLLSKLFRTSWLPSKKESNTWGAIFPNPYRYEYKMTGNKR